MLQIIEMNKFTKELKLAKKRGKNIDKLIEIVQALAKEEPLAAKHMPHPLSGQWKSFCECHIEPDWLLVYKVEEGILTLARTGTHSDLF
jgi:mRNA interferase YafQ